MDFDESFDIFADNADPLESALQELEDLTQDPFLQKNIKTKIEKCISILQDNKEDVSIRINRVSDLLDDVCDDTNMESFSRTRLYNVSQLLEQVD